MPSNSETNAVRGAGEREDAARVVVVGGGLAGLELAAALSDQGVEDVLVLEAGPGEDLDHIHRAHPRDRATELVFAPERDPYFRRPWDSASAPHYTGISGLRRRLGGRSLYWHGVVLPLEDWALATPWWPADVVADLTRSWQGGPSLYERVGADLAEWSGTAPEGAAGQQARTFGGQPFRPLPRACRQVPGDDRWEAYSALDRWRGEDGTAVPPPGVRVRCGTEVLAVDVRDGAVRGVLVRDPATGSGSIAADTVVLCAGTVESTRLAVQALTTAGKLAAPRLGGLADHIVQGFVVRLPAAPPGAARHVPDPGSYYVPTDPATRSYLRMDVQPAGDGELLLDVRTTGEQLPNPDSVVEVLTAAGPAGPARVRTALRPEDHEVIEAQRTVLRDFWHAVATELGTDPVPMEFTGFGDPGRDNTAVLPERIGSQRVGVPETWTSLLGTEDHEGGTLPLGDVLTSRHEFAGLPGLYAAGPAVFPRLGAANPSLTALALSRRLAAFLAGAA
ncbi:oxidoreductase [Streptomyces mashuensis]|uniref:Oxidoreductase n=1 Tax=Streptomyces mashuensis TaxID=33904 RepID=A0A919B409_9ACTN|nr:FAD-binding protein [Streptomyces mashuensis]GHF52198.1 oxidoreductase [Streptomyces mashuensis]